MTQSPWSDTAIRDTVAAITSTSEYLRRDTDMLWSIIWRWIVRALRSAYEFFAGTTIGKAIVITLFVLLLVAIIARIIMGVTESERSKERARKRAVQSGTMVSFDDVARHAAAGDYTAATHALYRALMQDLSDRGLVHLHESRTSGDYARELRRRGAREAASFGDFRRRFDRVVFRDAVVSESEFRNLQSLVSAVLTARSVAAGSVAA